MPDSVDAHVAHWADELPWMDPVRADQTAGRPPDGHRPSGLSSRSRENGPNTMSDLHCNKRFRNWNAEHNKATGPKQGVAQ